MRDRENRIRKGKVPILSCRVTSGHDHSFNIAWEMEAFRGSMSSFRTCP
jgi:hypothetical protein